MNRDIEKAVDVDGNSSNKQSAWIENEVKELSLSSPSSVASSGKQERDNQVVTESSFTDNVSTFQNSEKILVSSEKPSHRHRRKGGGHSTAVISKAGASSRHRRPIKQQDVESSDTERDTYPPSNDLQSTLSERHVIVSGIKGLSQARKGDVNNDALSVNSRRPSIGESSLDGSRSITSQSDTRSYRDKLRDRFQSVKDRVGGTVVEAKSRHQLRQYISRQSATSTRVDELLRKEEQEVVAALERHEQARSRWRKAVEGSKEISTEDEAYDFFARVWEPEAVPVGSPISLLQRDEEAVSPDSSGDIMEDHGEVPAGGSTKLLAADYLGLVRDEWEVVDHSAGAILPNAENLAAKEAELYFYPSSSPVPVENRLAPDQEVRYPEEEGLFVGNRPHTRRSNLHRLENRLLSEGNLKWFGDDGEIATLPDPVRKTPFRPPIIEDQILPQTIQVKYVPGVLTAIPGSTFAMEGDHHVLLELQIGTLQFQHHPLFSREHVLSQRLCDLYNQYRHRDSLRHVERLSGRLESLRQAYENLQLVLSSNAADTTPHQLDRMQRYKEEIRDTWRLLLAEGLRDRQLLASLLSCWRDLKRLREIQGFKCTPQRLSIQRERLTQEKLVTEQAKWEAEIRQASKELEAEYQEEYNHKWEEYQGQLRAWRKQQARNIKRRTRRKEQLSDNGVPEEEEDQTNSDITSQSLAPSGVLHTTEEPTEPAPVDAANVTTEVLDLTSNCLRPPGEPRLRLTLADSEKIDDDPSDPAEIQRRASLKRCRLFVKVLYNNKEVCRTQPHPLGSKFRIFFNECFAIRIVQPPESIMLALYEDGAGGGKHLLAQLYLPIPTVSTSLKVAKMENYEFSSDRAVTFNHAGVGSGTFITNGSGDTEGGCLLISGTLSTRIGWGEDPTTGHILAPDEKYLPSTDREVQCSDLLAQLGSEGKLDVGKLTEWARKSQLDPNDPANATFFDFIKNATTVKPRSPDFFRLNPLQTEFDFCPMLVLESNPRLRILSLRFKGEAEFKDSKLVPIREKEIPRDVFKAYEKRVSASARETELEVDLAWPDPLSSHRAWGRLYLDRVYQRVLAQCRQAQRTARLYDIVAEDQVPDISTLGLTFMKWLQPKRPLRPMRKERKKVAVQSLAGQDVRLMVNVIRAFEVPVRKNTDTLVGSQSAPSMTNLGFVSVPVRPFVEISFQGSTLRTSTAEGANPTWNQDLQIPVRPGSSDSDTLFIHLFDEVMVDLVEDDRLRETSVHQRLERHWLASLQFPFTTLVHNSRIEGTFKMYSPPMLLGYERESHQRAVWQSGWQTGSLSLDPGGQLFPHRDATFINLFITVQPALNPPEPFKERLESSEVAALEQHLINFEKEVEATVPHRRIKTLVIDVSGKSVCITRFLRPLVPPVISDDEPTTDEMAARFVSMVPVAPNQGLFDVWLTCDQVLRLGWGDVWAHAVLLCCYLLGLGQTAWLLVGTGIPHGPTAYVLVREKLDKGEARYWVWDPVAGQKYSIFDSFCPLQHIYGLINDENVWVNLQREELPRRTQFDLSRRSDWLPAIIGSGGTPLGSVQPSALQYVSTASSAAHALQDKLEKRLRDALMKWRRTQITLWNRYCIATLRKLLPRLERDSWSQRAEQTSPHHSRELQHILGSHKMCGFPINLPYTTTEAIMEAVRATGVHRNQDEEAEFALAVYVHPFPNNVLSVWVYIASLTKLRLFECYPSIFFMKLKLQDNFVTSLIRKPTRSE